MKIKNLPVCVFERGEEFLLYRDQMVTVIKDLAEDAKDKYWWLYNSRVRVRVFNLRTLTVEVSDMDREELLMSVEFTEQKERRKRFKRCLKKYKREQRKAQEHRRIAVEPKAIKADQNLWLADAVPCLGGKHEDRRSY